MAYDMPYGLRTYHFFYTMLCIGPHFNCIHDTRRGPHEMHADPHLPIPGLTYFHDHFTTCLCKEVTLYMFVGRRTT